VQQCKSNKDPVLFLCTVYICVNLHMYIIVKKTSPFKTVCKDDSGYITQRKQQKSKKVILLSSTSPHSQCVDKAQCDRRGPSCAFQKGGIAPKFSAHLYCGQTAGSIKMALGMEVGLGPGHIVLDATPQFSAHFYCSQTAGCIKMPLGTEVGLSPGDFVLDEDRAPLPKKCMEPPIFGPCLLWLNGWMDQDGTWHGGTLQPRGLCVRWGLSPSPKRGQSPQFSAHDYCGQTAAWIKMPLGAAVGLGSDDIVLDGTQLPSPKRGRSPLPNFRPMSIVARRLDGSRWYLAWRWALVQATMC